MIISTDTDNLQGSFFMEKVVVVEVLEKLIKREINEALKPMALQVEKIEFTFDERLFLIISLETTNSNMCV